MKRFFESVLPVVTLLCAVGSWLGFPRLGFLAGCAADLSVRVPGDCFFWLILILPLPALLLLSRSLKHPGKRFCRLLSVAALGLALFSFAAMANLYWQYHICEIPFVEISTGQHGAYHLTG